ncbi:MAG: glycosyltransferase [Candidatus Paceibacterota bacterium]|jgi:glycosyltransferase involved in cell wall biosynthesis
MISVIIPAYNEEKNIGSCLESLFSQKDATDWEIIVVDNASSDRTAEIASGFPGVKIIKEPKKGVTLARNRGAAEARGDILFFLDADAIVSSDYLKRISEKFEKDKDLIVVSGPYSYAIDSNFYIKLALFFVYYFLAWPAECFFNRFLGLASSLNAGNFAVVKKHFLEVGGFNENIALFGDEADLAYRLGKRGKIRFFLNLKVRSSARRFKKEGVLRLCAKYVLNVIWPVIFKKPFTKEYIDVR